MIEDRVFKMGRSKNQEQRAYDYVVSKINNNEFMPHERVKEMDIAHALDVSRTPVRGAFERLERDHYIRREPYKGALILKPQLNNVMFIERLQYLELLTTYYFQKLETREVTHDVQPLISQYEKLTTLEFANDDAFEEEEIELWKQLLVHSENSYVKGSIIYALSTIFLTTGRIQSVVHSSRKNKLKHYKAIVEYLKDNNYPLIRRELRILFNQLNLNVYQGMLHKD